MGSIYKITNSVNGKVYIGQTMRKPEDRWRQHINNSMRETSRDYNSYFHNAIRKYGKEVFVFEEIERCDNTELDIREIFWIDYYQSFNNKYGYNLTLGGQGSPRYADEEILKLWHEGKSVGEIHDETGINRGWVSVRLKACGITDEEIAYRRYKSSKEKTSMAVYQYALSGEYIRSFNSVSEARRATGIGHIEKCCAEKQRQSGGFQWSYKKLEKLPPYEYKRASIVPKAVFQIDEVTKKIIAEYKTMAEASRVIGVDISGIASVCKGTQYTAGGYCWACKSDWQFKSVV